MKKIIAILPLLLLLATLPSCMKGEHVDLIVHNARIHSMDASNTIYEAIAIRDGKIVEVGPERQILNKYSSDESVDAGGKDIYPGLTDAHGHLLSYAKQKMSVELFGCKSMDELLFRTEKYQSKKKRKFIIGRGWDQSLWGETELPTNEKLNERFPDVPVCLYRVDGHALLANDAALKLAGFTADTKIDGGIVVTKDGKCTGLLVDNAIEPMEKYIPEFSTEELKATLLEIQNELYQYGIIGVHEAGIQNKELMILKEMALDGSLQLEVYGMLLDSPENRAFVEKNGIQKWGNLYVRSFKMYGDGALGSRGALLKKPYSDQHDHHGVLTTPRDKMKELAQFCLTHNYQLNSHAIGDSTNYILLDLYKMAQEANKDHRWRIEHAQVVDPKDFALFAEVGVYPSVQPTHAVSDQRWAEDRLGQDRMQGAYAYKTLLKKTGMLAIGTDFPVEQTNPFLTIHAAVQRKDGNNVPGAGFLKNEALTLEETMRGMTIWAALASFRETETGSLEAGKDATFCMFVKPIVSNSTFQENFAQMVYINGKKVYSVE